MLTRSSYNNKWIEVVISFSFFQNQVCVFFFFASKDLILYEWMSNCCTNSFSFKDCFLLTNRFSLWRHFCRTHRNFPGLAWPMCHWHLYMYIIHNLQKWYISWISGISWPIHFCGRQKTALLELCEIVNHSIAKTLWKKFS